MKERILFTICLGLFGLGFLAVQLAGDKFLEELSPSPLEQEVLTGQMIHLTGQVYRKEQSGKQQILYLKNNSISDTGHIDHKNQSFKESRILIYDDKNIPVKIGNILLAEGQVSFFEPARNPGNFDQKFYYQKQNIHAMIWSKELKITGKEYWKVREWLSGIRKDWQDHFYTMAGEEKGGILCAMILGDKRGMDPEIKELYQSNGIAHVLAISGLHLTFIGMGVYSMVRKLCGSYAFAGVIGMTFLWAYILMAGMSVSAVRAMVMFFIRLGADMSGRVYDAMTSLSVAAAVGMIWRPLSYYDGGFQLSFGAVLGIAYIYPMISSYRKPKGKLAESMWAGISIYLVTLPVLLYHFYEFPVYSILLNLIVIPCMSAILLFGLLGGIVYPAAPFIGELFIKGCEGILAFYEILCEISGRLPGSRIVTGQPGIWQIVSYYICLTLAVLMLRRGRKKEKHCRKQVLLGMILVPGVLVLVIPQQMNDHNTLQITMLDVGQGDGIFIKGGKGLTCLIDGGSSDEKEVGKYRIEPFLKSQGIGTLDYVCISHGDADHINGIAEMLERKEYGVKIKCLVLPVQDVWDERIKALLARAKELGIRTAVIEPGQQIQDSDLKLTCIQPGGGDMGDIGNASSMVLDLSFHSFHMLFTGDVEGEGEEQLKQKLKTQYQILKVSHHGSKNSTDEELLGVVRPLAAMISAGPDNRYGHPHAETLERLEKMKCRIYNTAESGAVTIRTDGTSIQVSTFIHK